MMQQGIHWYEPIGIDGWEESPKICINAPLVLHSETPLLSVCPDGGDTTKRFLEMCIYGTSTYTVQTLELSGRSQVIPLNPVVHPSERYNQCDKYRHSGRDDDHGEDCAGAVYE